MEILTLVLKNIGKLIITILILALVIFGVIKIYNLVIADKNPVAVEEELEEEVVVEPVEAELETVVAYLSKPVEVESKLISKTGTILAGQQVTVTPEIGANIKELKVSEGKLVKKGDLLATLENSSQLQSAVVSYNSAISLLRNAEQLLNITAQSGEVGLSTFEEQFAQAQINIEKAAIQLESAQAIRYNQFEIADINSATETLSKKLVEKTATPEEARPSALETENDFYTQYLQDAIETNQDTSKFKSRELEMLQGQVQDSQNYLNLENSHVQLSLLAKQMQSTQLQNQASIVNAKNQIIQVRQQVESAKISLSLGEIRSPINGVVSNLNVTVGSRVNAGAELFTVVNFDEIKVKLYLSPAEIQAIAGTSKSDIETKISVLGTLVEARINYLGVIANAQTRTIPVEVSPIFKSSSEKSSFIPNSFAKVTFELTSDEGQSVETDNQFRLPLSALVKAENQLQVAVLSDDKVVFKPIEIAPGIVQGKIAIASGIQDGDKIILNPSSINSVQ